MPKFSDRLQHAWNAFRYGEQQRVRDYGPGYYYSPSRVVRRIGTERSIVMALYNRIATDVSSVGIKHVRLDENGRYAEDITSGLNNCLTLEANIDQTARAFIQDVVLSMLEEGVVAVVPVETTLNPTVTGSYDINTMRTGKITQWYPKHVTVNLYNEETGQREDVRLPKSVVAIIENPFYAVMNEPNSTLQRLIRKLSLLDDIDEQSGSGKLDLIIQLPYTIKSEARRQQAEERRKSIEMQLAGSKYGIAYADATEHITQLNRPVENNLMKQIEYLTSMLYSQLGLTEEILKGTADEKVNLNYINNTIEPIVSAICTEYKRKFLTKTARSQRQSIQFFREPFKLVPVDNLAEIADKFTRNEIMSSNEFRQVIGMKPSADPKADELRNSNMPHENEEQLPGLYNEEQAYNNGVGQLDNIDSQLDLLEDQLGHSDINGVFLSHYASPYYDPVKAHEYYMKHRQLKGRTSTSDLNDTGKEAAALVKQRLLEEKKKKIQDSNDVKTSTIQRSQEETQASNEQEKSSTSAKIESFSRQAQSRIDQLRDSLSTMSKEERQSSRETISKEIASIRDEVALNREQLNAAYSNFAQSSREHHKSVSESARELHKQNSEQAKQEYDRKLEAELEKMKNDASFKKVKKRR